MNFPLCGTVCKFEGCRNPRNDAGGFCNAHKYQQRVHGRMWTLRKRRKNGEAAAQTDADKWIAEVRARKATP